MEVDTIVKKNKAKRTRNKLLCTTLRKQFEFYFSDSNIQKSIFMTNLINQSENGFVPINVISDFNIIKRLTSNKDLILKSLSTSSRLELNEDKTCIRRKDEIQILTDTDDRTIYIEGILMTDDHRSLERHFKKYGDITYISIPRYRGTKDNKGFAFIEFASEISVQSICKEYNIDLSKEKMGIFPAISKYQKQLAKLIYNKGYEMPNCGSKSNSEKDSIKNSLDPLSDDSDNSDGSPAIKRLKREADEEAAPTENRPMLIADDHEFQFQNKDKNVRTHISANSQNFRIITKNQWITLRNNYLTEQKLNIMEMQSQLRLIRTQRGSQYDNNDDHSRGHVLQQGHCAERDIMMDQDPEQIVPMKELKKNTAPPPPAFVADTILRYLAAHSLKRSEVRVMFESLLNNRDEDAEKMNPSISYVDMMDGDEKCEVRCKDADIAKTIMSLFQAGEGQSLLLLKGDEETEYWKKLTQDREKRLLVKSRSKNKNNKVKLMKKAEKILVQKAMKHKHFEE